MSLKDDFLSLVSPLLDMVDLDGLTDEEQLEYLEIEDARDSALKALKEVLSGNLSAAGKFIEFIEVASDSKFLQSDHKDLLSRIVKLSLSVPNDAWDANFDRPEGLRLIELSGLEALEEIYSFDNKRVECFFFASEDIQKVVAFLDFSSLGSDFWEKPFGIHTNLDCTILIESLLLLLHRAQDRAGKTVSQFIVSSADGLESARAHLKYHLILSGMKFGLSVELPNVNLVQQAKYELQNCITAGDDYCQFLEPFSMLSEVNSKTSLIDTFLSTYHVLENYMIRTEVSQVLTGNPGRSFQRVRDFKRLGQQIDSKEKEHLERLFEKSSDLDIGGTTIASFLSRCLGDLVQSPVWDEGGFNEFLIDLGIVSRSGAFITYQHLVERVDIKRFAGIVYAIRCAIVHNKATEFHLSNEELDRYDARKLFLSELCLPVMQRMAFGLPSALPANNPIHYRTRELHFY